ncbi:MAG: pyrroline-5-carboxylate reductase [Prevotella sp.]|nr:pyrroline-5-carboxylate reductase [Prevotella sp.]
MKISVIGAGEMGGAFAAGLLKGTLFQANDITVANPHEGKLTKFAQLGASVTTDNKVAADGADFVAIVVKPGVVKSVIDEIKDELDYKKQTIINMAASITIDQLEEWLKKDGEVPEIFQAIPNIGIEERASMTFIAPNGKGAANINKAKDIFDDLGLSMVTNESLLFTGTAMAGCGIAYVMRFMRAATEAGVELGFKANDAKDIIVQTMNGAVKLLQANGGHPEAEIDKVTTPGGMTIRGLNAMEKNGFSNAVIEGIKASLKK